MTDKTIDTGLPMRNVAPRLFRLGEHEWAWTPLADRAAITRRSAAAIWEEFCFDARAYYIDNNWSGRKWKFARPAGDGKYDVLDVWDVKTGERRQVPPEVIDGILLPAGWSKCVDKPTIRLEDALRKTIALARQHPIGMIGSSLSKVVEDMAFPMLSEAIASVQHCELEPAFEQMLSAPDGLLINNRHYVEETSKIMVTIQEKRGSLDLLRMMIHIRVVLGNLRLTQLSLYNY